MNKNVIFAAATRALVQQGLPGTVAEKIIASTVAVQGAEWSRIIARGEKGELSRVYIVVKHDGDRKQGFVYAPAKQEDNIRHVENFLRQGPDIGAEAYGPESQKEPDREYYPVSHYDVGIEVKKAIAQLAAQN
jgi:hypothetical protein